MKTQPAQGVSRRALLQVGLAAGVMLSAWPLPQDHGDAEGAKAHAGHTDTAQIIFDIQGYAAE